MIPVVALREEKNKNDDGNEDGGCGLGAHAGHAFFSLLFVVHAMRFSIFPRHLDCRGKKETPACRVA